MDSPGAVGAGAAVEIVAGVNGIVVVPLKKADVVRLWQGWHALLGDGYG